MARTIFPVEARLFQAGEWKRVGYESKRGRLLRRLVRAVEVVDENLQDSALTYADLVVDATNDTNQTVDPAAIGYVDTPRAGVKTYAGRWGLVSNEAGPIRIANEPPGKLGIIQTLRWGWAATILTAATPPAVDFSNALVKYRRNRNELTITWVNLAPTALQACAEQVPDSLADGVQIRGNTFAASGGWIRKGPVESELDDDGMGVLVAVFASEPDAVGDVQAGTGLVLAGKTATETTRHAYLRCNTRAEAITAAATVLASLPEGTHLAASFQHGPEGFEVSFQRADAVPVDSGWFQVPSSFGNYPSLLDGVRVFEGWAIQDLKNLMAALPPTVSGPDGIHVLHYSLRPGHSPFSGRFGTILHRNVGAIVNPIDPWVNFTVNGLVTTQERYMRVGDVMKVGRRRQSESIKQTYDYGAATTFAYTLNGPDAGDWILLPGCRVEDHGRGRWRGVAVMAEKLWQPWVNSVTGA